MSYYNSLTKKYPVDKTIRVGLLPIGETSDNIKKSNILNDDKKRNNNYHIMTGLLDEIYQETIEESLTGFKLSGLDNIEKICLKKELDKDDKKLLKSECAVLREQIVEQMKKDKNFEFLGKKEMINMLKEKYSGNNEIMEVLEQYDNSFTLFSKYTVNRKQLTSAEENPSSVPYRLIDVNFLRFVDNKKCYGEIKKTESLIKRINKKLQESLFTTDGYNFCLTQKGINDYNKEIGKLNSMINEYNQKEAKRIPQMKVLYKLILSSSDDKFIEEYDNDESLINEVKVITDKIIKEFNRVDNFIIDLKESRGEGVFVKNDKSKTLLSNIIFGQYNQIDLYISNEYDRKHEKLDKNDRYYEKKHKEINSIKSFSLKDINSFNDDENVDLINIYTNRLQENMEVIIKYKEEFNENVIVGHDKTKKLAKNKKAVATIKELLDSIKDIERNLKLIYGNGDEIDRNQIVYSELEIITDKIMTIDSVYNKTRNYLTKKPYTEEKIKLTFNRPTLLSGWDQNKEKDNLCVLFLKDNKVYLGVMNAKYNKTFVNIPKATTNNVYKKVNYKLLPGANKMLPKVFFSKANIGYYAPSKEVMDIYKNGTFKKGKKFSINDCHKMIEFYKASINKHPEWSKFDFDFLEKKNIKKLVNFIMM